MAMYLAGYHHFFMITLLATLTALVPLLGTWLIWGPFALWLGFHEGHWATATALALYGSIFVGLLDNVIRAYVLNSNVKLHPLLAFVSVLGGIEVMGLWGVFIGPIVASCLHALVKIFNTELVEFSLEKQTGRVVVPNDATLPLPGAQESKPVAATVAPPAPTIASSTPPMSPPIMSPPIVTPPATPPVA